MMTLNEAIAEMHEHGAKPAVADKPSEKMWVDGMLDIANEARGYAWGIIWGAFLVDQEHVGSRLRAFWRDHARPKPEWREVETPAVRVATITDVELREKAGFVFVTFSGEKTRRFRIRQAEYPLRLVIEREVCPE